MDALEGKRIGVLSSWASRRNGGVWTAVQRQAQMIADMGAVPVLCALDDGDKAAVPWEVHRAKSVGPDRLGFSPGLVRTLRAARLDMLHLHGIWHGPSHAGAIWAKATGKPYVVSPHGMLEPWIVSRNRMEKGLFRTLIERRNWRAASVIHALTAAEAEQVAHHAPVAKTTVIPNAAPPVSGAARAMPPPHILYLGRFHEKKNLISLIDAWRNSTDVRPADARLTLTGWGSDSYRDAMQQATGQDTTITITRPVRSDDAQSLLASARFAILPSLSEGLPMAMLEAWAARTPTIMTGACNLPEGFQTGAALECGTGPDAIGAALRQAFAINEPHWQTASQAASVLASGPFSSATVARKWRTVYGRLLSQTDNGDG